MATPTPKDKETPSKNLNAFSSPAPRSVPPSGNVNMMSYDSPAVLHMLNDVASSGMGGVGMGITMSGLGMSSLGMSASAMGRADEAERSRRLRAIIDLVGKKPGRVSEEGLLQLCKRMGIPCEKHMDEAGTWSLLIGDEALCDVTFHNDEIASVNLQTGLDESRPDLHFGTTGSEILVRSLKPLPGQSKLNVTLERFSESLEKLLTLDKLGSAQNGGVSCYNAIAGVYTSLRKLFEHEKRAELAKRTPDERFRTHKAEREVLCKKSGRPRLNGGSCLGLSLEYWMDGRMQIDPPVESAAYPEDADKSHNKMYSLTIECEASPSTLYTPIRISDDWISDRIDKPTDTHDANATLDNILMHASSSSLDWLDPKPTYLEPAPEKTADDHDDHDAMNLDSAAGRLPNVRFVAKFNPPLVVPFAVHMQLYQLVGIEPRTDDFRPETFAGLALRPGEVDPGMSGTTVGDVTHEIRSSRTVLVRCEDGTEKDRRHDMSLFIPKLEYSRTLEALPFSHPKQLVEVLPVLRQYAHITSLLKTCFYEAPKKQVPTHKLGHYELTPPPPPPPPPPHKAAHVVGDLPRLQLDVNLSYAPPVPRFTLHVPHPRAAVAKAACSSEKEKKKSKDADDAAMIADLLSHLDEPTTTSSSSSSPSPPPAYHAPLALAIDVQANGELVLAEQNIVFLEEEDDDDAKVKRLARALDVVDDLGVWAEWLRLEVGKEEEERERKKSV
ncbi:mediator complex subunit med1 [Alternaria alternata]|nr:mediator complex subunit med1 [Alternaria alternata]